MSGAFKGPSPAFALHAQHQDCTDFPFFERPRTAIASCCTGCIVSEGVGQAAKGGAGAAGLPSGGSSGQGEEPLC